MNFAIFCISLIGIVCICYIVANKEEIMDNNKLEITLTKYNVNESEKDDIIVKIKSGDYENILDIVDNVDIH